jgi:hypothetical protein
MENSLDLIRVWLSSIVSEALAPVVAEQQAQRKLLERMTPAAPVEPGPVVVPAPSAHQLVAVITSPGGQEQSLTFPITREGRQTQAVPASIAGATSLRVVVDHGLNEGTPWADVWFRNDAAMLEGGGSASYSVRLLLDGQEVLRQDSITHHQYTAWGRMLGTPPMPTYPRTADLIAKGLVARYQLGPVREDRLADYAAAMADPSWNELWSPRRITQYMPGTGGRDDIGPATMAQAVALQTGDQRAIDYVIGQAEAACGIPWHFWDAQRGRWLSVEDYPGLWADGRADVPLLQPIPDANGWVPETAHQPDLSYVAYLLTGRRAFLDNLQAQAAWNIVAQWNGVRGDTGLLVVKDNQVRGAAWALRQIDEAAFLSPPGPDADYFARASVANWSWIVSQIPAWTKAQGEPHGWLPGVYGVAGGLSPWQQDYFASTAIAAARQGNADARTYLEWAANFLVGRFEHLGQDGAVYLMAIADEKTGANHKTWAQVASQTKARGWSNGTTWANAAGNYSQWARASLAGLADVLGSAEARKWFEWLPANGAPFTQPSDYFRDPLLRIVAG